MQLAEQGAVSEGTARLMCAALSPKALSVPIPEPLKDALRAKMMRSMLTTVAKNNNRLESEG
jgi:transcriptional regulator CtsR